MFFNKKKKILFFCIQNIFVKFLVGILEKLINYIQIKALDLKIYAFAWNVCPLVNFLKRNTQCQLNFLVDIVVYDIPNNTKRFIVIYLLLSHKFNCRTYIITKTNETLPLMSISSLFRNSLWLEREVWDFFGIFFLLNRDLRKILSAYGFKSYPLRKDFPLTGFYEVIYDDSQKRILNKTLELSQEYRYFNFNSFWMKN